MDCLLDRRPLRDQRVRCPRLRSRLLGPVPTSSRPSHRPAFWPGLVVPRLAGHGASPRCANSPPSCWLVASGTSNSHRLGYGDLVSTHHARLVVAGTSGCGHSPTRRSGRCHSSGPGAPNTCPARGVSNRGICWMDLGSRRGFHRPSGLSRRRHRDSLVRLPVVLSPFPRPATEFSQRPVGGCCLDSGPAGLGRPSGSSRLSRGRRGYGPKRRHQRRRSRQRSRWW